MKTDLNTSILTINQKTTNLNLDKAIRFLKTSKLLYFTMLVTVLSAPFLLMVSQPDRSYLPHIAAVIFCQILILALTLISIFKAEREVNKITKNNVALIISKIRFINWINAYFFIALITSGVLLAVYSKIEEGLEISLKVLGSTLTALTLISAFTLFLIYSGYRTLVDLKKLNLLKKESKKRRDTFVAKYESDELESSFGALHGGISADWRFGIPVEECEQQSKAYPSQ